MKGDSASAASSPCTNAEETPCCPALHVHISLSSSLSAVGFVIQASLLDLTPMDNLEIDYYSTGSVVCS